MCGIAGLIGTGAPVTRDIVRAMTDPIRSRGPDDAGEWVDENVGVGFGHRRLAVVDLSAAGHQPMISACRRYVLTFNGEIYNHRDLRAELEAERRAPGWQGHSDTEVLLAAIVAWGVDPALRRLSGMFAFALWDRDRRVLTLARDRFGEKPLYYGWTAAGFAFASTLAPIRATPGFANPVCTRALSSLMARAYIPAPWSIHRHIYKLPAGCLLSIPTTAAAAPPDEPPDTGSGMLRLERYFDYADDILAGAAHPIEDSGEAADAVENALGEAVSRQFAADVPVGTFLSGGVDSSLVTALAQRGRRRPVKTFSIGFRDAAYDEAPFAARVAAALGTDHSEHYVTADDVLDIVPALPTMYDEPFADSSQLPTHIVARMARESVTVALSGDGGDEMFGGYHRHRQLPSMWRKVGWMPPAMRRWSLALPAALPSGLWNRLADLSGQQRSPWFGRNMRHGFGVTARADGFDALLDGFLDDWALGPSPLAGTLYDPMRLATDRRLAALPRGMQVMHVDTVAYLADDILTKVDRAAMAVSLETRIPFLDPAVAAVAARLSPSLKLATGGGKSILRRLLHRHVPPALVDRSKAGFAIPIGQWLRGPLRDWAEDLLSPAALGADGLFETAVIRARWARHLAGREDASQPIWSVLAYQAWRRSIGNSPPPLARSARSSL